MGNYVKEAVATHPFNFFTLIIAFAAAAFAGWSAYEARLTRQAADDAAREQNNEVKKSRIAAEASSADAHDIAVQTKRSIEIAEQTMGVNKTMLEQSRDSFQLQQRPWLYASFAGFGTIWTEIKLTNKGRTPAYNLEPTCYYSDEVGSGEKHQLFPYGDERPSFVPVEDSAILKVPLEAKSALVVGRILACTVRYKDVFSGVHELLFCFEQFSESYPDLALGGAPHAIPCRTGNASR